MGGLPATPSSLPMLVCVVPLAAGAVVLLGARLGRRFWHAVTLLATAITAGIGLLMAGAVLAGAPLVSWRNELRVDALSALLVATIGVIGFLTCIYSKRYVEQTGLLTRLGEEAAARRLPLFHALLLWFIGTMIWGAVTNNIVILYVAVEATTLSSGFLVAFYWDRKALEAGYKYLMLLTIGITFALMGCVLTYAAAASTGQLAGHDPLLLSELRRVIPAVPRGTALIAAAFLIVGFGTKAGIAPFHPWLPDAHAEAPTPISVLLSGVMIKMAIYALARTVSMFYPSWPTLAVFLVALGTFTMVLGVVMALVQDDLKRMLAYSSVSQMGYVLAGLGLGTALGCFGGLFHLLNHALIKALLFMCVGAVIYATGARRLSELGGLARRMPVTSGCFLVGALAISGFPPFNGFLSKLTVFVALAQSHLWWALALAVATGVLTAVVLVRAAYSVFWRDEAGRFGDAREAPWTMLAPMIVVAALCVVLGVAPQLVAPLLEQAAAAVATVGR